MTTAHEPAPNIRSKLSPKPINFAIAHSLAPRQQPLAGQRLATNQREGEP
jgi:hypothetical protein